MTIEFAQIGQGTCLSSDTKTSKPAGWRLLETDTGDIFISDGTYWWLQHLGPWSPRKIGNFGLGPNFTSSVGPFANMSAATSPGTQSNTNDTTNGRYQVCVTGAVSGNRGGYRQANPTYIRQWNPRLWYKFKLVSQTVDRLFLGHMGGNPTNPPEPAGDDTLNAGNGFLFGMSTTSSVSASHWLILHNDGTGATVVEDTGITFDANVHTIKLVADESNTRFSWSLDGGAYTHVTTDIPAATTNMAPVFEIETAEAVGKSFNLYNGFCQQDK